MPLDFIPDTRLSSYLLTPFFEYQEEKERKKLAAKLPKVEAELEEQILTWEKENGRQFQVCGVRYMEYVKTQRDNHEIEKQMVRVSLVVVSLMYHFFFFLKWLSPCWSAVLS